MNTVTGLSPKHATAKAAEASVGLVRGAEDSATADLVHVELERRLHRVGGILYAHALDANVASTNLFGLGEPCASYQTSQISSSLVEAEGREKRTSDRPACALEGVKLRAGLREERTSLVSVKLDDRHGRLRFVVRRGLDEGAVALKERVELSLLEHFVELDALVRALELHVCGLALLLQASAPEESRLVSR